LREIEFDGWLLGSSSTEGDDSLRWTEIHIYKTEGGSYIIERLGKSLVYHRKGRCSSKPNWVEVPGAALGEDSQPCDVCRPRVPEDDDFNSDEKFLHETMISSAEVVNRAEDMHDALSMFDRKRKISQISHPAAQALQNAAANDPDLLQAIIRKVRVK
jgi:hypothetical protein